MKRIACQTKNELSFLCDLYGSDKGSQYGGGAYYPSWAHTYTPIYERFFQPIRESAALIFECGLGTNNTAIIANMGKNAAPGASLRVWRDYFPNAQIIGADIDKTILFKDDRIETGYIDQTAPETINHFFGGIKEKYSRGFDIMIDDGCHVFEANKCLLVNAFPFLKEGGYYIIEDVNLHEIRKNRVFLDEFEKEQKCVVQYMLMPMDYFVNNNLIIIKKQG
jgi:SAM-dependent methyltransferase